MTVLVPSVPSFFFVVVHSVLSFPFVVPLHTERESQDGLRISTGQSRVITGIMRITYSTVEHRKKRFEQRLALFDAGKNPFSLS